MRKAAENRFCEINRESCVIQFENGLTGFTLERLLRKITCLKVYDPTVTFSHTYGLNTRIANDEVTKI